MNASNSDLASPRAILTSLITTLTSPTISTIINSPQPPVPTQQASDAPFDADSLRNPLRTLLPSHRAILTTLHVLLPTGILLQSLDLLDRGSVVKFTQGLTERERTQGAGPESLVEDVVRPQAHVQLPLHNDHGQSQRQTPVHVTTHQQTKSLENVVTQKIELGQTEVIKTGNVLYQVCSSQAPKSRFKNVKTTDVGTLTYTVRLGSWNCSCAAFAFESFPGQSISTSQKPWLDLESNNGLKHSGQVLVDEKRVDAEWEFGDLSCDGKGHGGGKVPVCKHLLACLLIERWDVLRGFLHERVVGREEMAGLGGEG